MAALFDIVIPVGPLDPGRFRKGISFNKSNIIGYRNIYIVSNKDVFEKIKDIESSNIIFIDEEIYPFDKKDIFSILKKEKRLGWYLQQLLKLYAGFIIPGVLPRWLVIDSDTMFLKPTPFIYDGKAAYNIAVENREIYFDHMAKLHPTLRRFDKQFSGIVHHMMFESVYVKQLFEMVESHHNNKSAFWRIFLEQVIEEERDGSGASEYEIYFNFLLIHHRSNVVIRPLSMANVHVIDTSIDVDYISAHSWMSHTGEQS